MNSARDVLDWLAYMEAMRDISESDTPLWIIPLTRRLFSSRATMRGMNVAIRRAFSVQELIQQVHGKRTH